MHANSGTFRTDDVHARAYSLTAGFSFRFSDRFRIGASVSDINTTLKTRAVTTKNGRTYVTLFEAKLPVTVNAEAAWAATDKLLLTVGYRAFTGNYGSNNVDIRAAYLGGEYTFDGGWILRGGAMRVLNASFGTNTSLQLPFPFVPCIGAGWTNGRMTVDAALYAHPVMSFHYGRPAPTVDVSFSYTF